MLSPSVAARRAPLRHALGLLVLLAVAVSVAESVLAARATEDHQVLIASFPLVGGGFVVVGAYAWVRRPLNQTGELLSATGVLILGAALADTGLPDLLVRTGLLLGETPIAAVLHVVLAFPSGRLRRADARLVQALYVLVLARQLPVALPGPDLEPLRLTCSLLGAAVLVVAAASVVVRVRRDDGGAKRRRALTAVYGYGMALLLFFPFSARVLQPLFGFDAITLAAIQVAGLAVLPPVFAAGILLGGFAWTYDTEELSSWLGGQVHDQATLRDVLARVLGDPSLEVLFDEPRAASGRGVVRVHGADGHDAGVTLTYDLALFADPYAVQEAGRVVAVALERERLRADLLAEREALRASRARVIEVGDLQRRELAQDLHDVLQSRLTLAAMHAGRLAASADPQLKDDLDQLRGQLDVLTAEMRQVVHGVMPALLLERGLAAAVEDLTDRMPIPTDLEVKGADLLAPVVATNSYFILAEALTNVVRHASATRLSVRVCEQDDELLLVVQDDGVGGARATGGAGLRGIADRVDALEGTLTLVSPAGQGTRLEVVLPCAS